MTHTEPISVIVWQGNNIMEPINISWGAALLMEQQDMALAHHSASPSSLTGKPQPSAELAAAWPFLEGRGPKDRRTPYGRAHLGQLEHPTGWVTAVAGRDVTWAVQALEMLEGMEVRRWKALARKGCLQSKR